MSFHSNPDRQAILRRRAAAFARPPALSTAPTDVIDVVEFFISGERYAVETAYVSETAVLTHLTALPCAPNFVVGIVNIRRRIRHVIDLREFFELPPRGIVDLHHVIFIQHGESHLGLLADLVTGLRQLPRASLQLPPPTFAGIRADYLKGITSDGLAVLDAVRIVTDRRQIVREEVDLPPTS
jgi:purine-binding chemotaxis protein CheW